MATQAFLRFFGEVTVQVRAGNRDIQLLCCNGSGLKFTLDERSNAEVMSVSSKLPLLKVENHFVAGYDAITAYARLRVRHFLWQNIPHFSVLEILIF